MVDRKDKCVPQIRFPEFKNDGEWNVKELRDLAVKITDKNTRNLELPVLTNSATEGVIKQTDYFEREIVTKENLCNYYVVEVDDFVYNPRISSTAPVGPVSRNKRERGLLSPLYTVFRFKKGHLDFYEQFFKTYYWHYYLKKKANWGARFDRINISSEDFFSMPLPAPSLKEQKAIASCLTSLDACISASKVKLEQLKAHKKGLMQKLFPAPGKTIPEYRFPEFDKEIEWNERLLGDIGNTYPGLSGKNSNDFGHGDAEYITYMNVFSNPIVKTELNQPIEVDPKQHQVKYGDVLFTVSSETPEEVGMSSVWLGKKENVYLNSFCFGYRLRDQYDFIFLSYFFRSPSFRKRMMVLSQGIARYNISKNNVMGLTIQFPSLNEQKKIAGCLFSLDEMISYCSQEISSLEEQKKSLMQQLFPQM